MEDLDPVESYKNKQNRVTKGVWSYLFYFKWFNEKDFLTLHAQTHFFLWSSQRNALVLKACCDQAYPWATKSTEYADHLWSWSGSDNLPRRAKANFLFSGLKPSQTGLIILAIWLQYVVKQRLHLYGLTKDFISMPCSFPGRKAQSLHT